MYCPEMNKSFLLLVLFIIACVKPLYATTGGPRFLTFLGQKDSSLYFIYEFHDESANLPELWEYNSSLDTLIINDNWLNYPGEAVSEGLKRMLLSKLKTNGLPVTDSIIFTFKDPIQVYYEEFNEYFNEFPVVVIWDSNEFQIIQCFENSSHPKVMTSGTFPTLGVSMAIIRYKGVCIETGYEKDTLLIRKIPSSDIAGKEIENNDHKVLIISLLILAVGLITFIFLNKEKHHNKKIS